MKKLIMALLIYTTMTVSAQQTIEYSLFNGNETVQTFKSENHLAEYIKSNKPSTYLYFERLSSMAKKRVFQKHQEDQQQDITEIVLAVYKKRGRY